MSRSRSCSGRSAATNRELNGYRGRRDSPGIRPAESGESLAGAAAAPGPGAARYGIEAARPPGPGRVPAGRSCDGRAIVTTATRLS